MIKKKNRIFHILILLFIGLGLVSCGNKEDKVTKNKIYIESFDYELNRNKNTVANELSYSLSFDIHFTLNQEFDVNDLVVRIATVEEIIDNKKFFHFNIDNSNTENVTFSSSTEQYPYILLKYAIVDVTSFKVSAQIKITSKDLMDDINNFIKIDCYSESKEIVDENNILDNGIFKMSFSDDSLIHYEFNEFSESYEVVSVIAKSETFEVPATYKGYPVKTIGEGAFYGCSKLKILTIPDSVTTIEKDAFEGCDNIEQAIIPALAIPFIPKKNLKEVTITNGTTIEKSAFEGCSNLVSITIPDSITSIGNDAFYGCNSLENITIPNSVTSIGENAFFDCDNLKYNEYNNACYLGNMIDPYLVLIKAKSTKITSCEIHSNARIVNDSAFSKCSSLTSIIIPDSVTSIGNSAFKDCTSLRSAIIGNSVSSISDYTFYNCRNLSRITIGNSVTSIGAGAFQACCMLVEVYNLSSLHIAIGNENNGYIGYYAKVIHSSLEEKSNIITKDDYVFIKDKENKYFLVGYNGTETELVLPNDIEGNTYVINKNAFYYSSLTTIIISNKVTSIEERAFSSCRYLKKITIPNSVTSIGKFAFLSCPSLTHVAMGDGVTNIGNSAFRHCGNLTSITISNSVISIGESAFYGCSSLASVIIPNSVTSIGSGAFSVCSSLTSIVIPNSVTCLESNTFSDCENLTSVTIPNSVTSIGASAFYGCRRLKKITIPKSVTSIGATAFQYCEGLTSIVIPASVTSIGRSAFKDCSSLTSIVIPKSVTSIGYEAFRGCSRLTSIVIPNSVASIGGSAFYDCNNLKEVYFEGTSTDWKKITINVDVSMPVGALYYYSETKPITSGNYWHYVNGVAKKW